MEGQLRQRSFGDMEVLAAQEALLNSPVGERCTVRVLEKNGRLTKIILRRKIEAPTRGAGRGGSVSPQGS